MKVVDTGQEVLFKILKRTISDKRLLAEFIAVPCHHLFGV